jgi:putative membrane protein
MATTNDPVMSDSTRLALDRTFLAHERTLMAWVRTSTTLISFGFTIYKFFQGMRQSGELVGASEHPLGARTMGLIMISIGLAGLVLATVDHRRSMRQLSEHYGIKKASLALLLAALIGGLGILGLAAVVFRQ